MPTILIAVDVDTDDARGFADSLVQHIRETFNDDGTIKDCHQTSLLPNLDDDPDLAMRVVELDNARRYASLTLSARKFRAQGNIPSALSRERQAETIYRSLPEHFKW